MIIYDSSVKKIRNRSHCPLHVNSIFHLFFLVFFSTLSAQGQKVAIMEKKSTADKALMDWRHDAYRPRSADPKGRELLEKENQRTTLESQRMRSEIIKLEEERKQERGKNCP